MNHLKLLITLNNELEAQIIKQKLAEAGIECMFEAATDNMLPALDYSRGIDVFVEPDDFQVAQSLVNSGEDDLEDDMEIGVGD